MQDNKLIQILRSFGKVELRHFGEFVHASFFNKEKKTLRLFDILSAAHPEFPVKKVHREAVFANIFPNEPFKEQKLRYVISNLTKLAEKFLINNEIEKDEMLKQNLLLRAFFNRDLDKQFEHAYMEQRKSLEEENIKDSLYYQQLFKLEETALSFSALRQNRSVKKTNLQEVVDNLDIFYLATKLKYCCELSNRGSILSMEYEARLQEEILSYLEKNSFDNIPAISLYHVCLLMITEAENEKHYRKLKSLLKKHNQNFSPEELKDVYAFAQNHCIQQMAKGKPEYFDEIFNLYKILLKDDLIIDGKYLLQEQYKNIVTTGLRLREFEWVKEFIENYHPRLASGVRENAYHYNLGHYYFTLGEFNEALVLLNKVKFTDVFYALDTKALLLKIYYELRSSHIDSLFSLLDSFKAYLKRIEYIPEQKKAPYYNLIKFVHKITNLQEGNKEQLSELQLEIENTESNANIEWLKEKIQKKGILRVNM